jgi:hypothetical protein
VKKQTYPDVSAESVPMKRLPAFSSASVIMGAVTETDSLWKTVHGIASVVQDKNDIAEVLIAYPADRVTPECKSVLDALQKEDVGIRLDIFPQTRPGLGFSSDCIERATGSHCIFFQSDLGMDIQIISRLIEEAKKDRDTICTTSRWLPGCSWNGYGAVKKTINRLAQVFLRILFGGHLTDYTNPVQIIPTAILQSIRWEKTDFSRCMELQVKPIRLGYRFREIPTNCYARMDGKSNNSARELLNYLLTAIQIRLMKKKDILVEGYPGPEGPADYLDR